MTIQFIIQELQLVPVNRLEEAYQLIHNLAATRPEQNEDILAQTRELAASFDEWSAEEWDAFDADLKQTRDELNGL